AFGREIPPEKSSHPLLNNERSFGSDLLVICRTQFEVKPSCLLLSFLLQISLDNLLEQQL
ncbi:MAG: hypothetical protein O2885_04230, partial [Proteobacteria bacterium]|nr:hypothetical protein [Pseudomonadota bacterium]